MRILIFLMFVISNLCLAARSADSSQVLNDAERARIKAQMQDLQRSKLQTGAQFGNAVKESASRQTQTIVKQQEQARQLIDKKAQEWSYVIGPDAAQQAGEVKKKALDQEMQMHKDKIARTAKGQVDRQQAVAKKYAENVSESIVGLKSQVAKKGQYGLQPKGSNLYVRQYGK